MRLQEEWQRMATGWFGCHQFYFPIQLGISSSQLTNSYFSEGCWNHQPVLTHHWKLGESPYPYTGVLLLARSMSFCCSYHIVGYMVGTPSQHQFLDGIFSTKTKYIWYWKRQYRQDIPRFDGEITSGEQRDDIFLQPEPPSMPMVMRAPWLILNYKTGCTHTRYTLQISRAKFYCSCVYTYILCIYIYIYIQLIYIYIYT